MLDNLHKAIKKPIVQNIGIVATGTALAQAVAMLFSPFITRVYGPEAFGVLGVFLSMLTILTPLATLSYPGGIVLPRDDDTAINLSRLSILVALVVSALTGVVLMVFKHSLGNLLNSASVTSYFYLLPFAMFMAAWLQVSQQWVLRKRLYLFSSKVAVLHSFIVNAAKLGAGVFNPLTIFLLVAATIGGGIHAFLLSLKLSSETARIVRLPGKWITGKLMITAREYRDFPLYHAPQVIINSLSQGLPVLFLASFYSPAAAGFYTISRMVMALPSQLIGKSVSDVFFPWAASAWQNNDNITRALVKSTLLMALVGIVPFGVIMAAGPWLFGLVFGQGWERAGDFATWMALWFYFAFINRPVVSIIPVIKLQKFFLQYEVASVIIRIAALLAGYYFLTTDTHVVALFSLSGALLNIYLVVKVINKYRVSIAGSKMVNDE